MLCLWWSELPQLSWKGCPRIGYDWPIWQIVRSQTVHYHHVSIQSYLLLLGLTVELYPPSTIGACITRPQILLYNGSFPLQIRSRNSSPKSTYVVFEIPLIDSITRKAPGNAAFDNLENETYVLQVCAHGQILNMDCAAEAIAHGGSTRVQRLNTRNQLLFCGTQ